MGILFISNFDLKLMPNIAVSQTSYYTLKLFLVPPGSDSGKQYLPDPLASSALLGQPVGGKTWMAGEK